MTSIPSSRSRAHWSVRRIPVIAIRRDMRAVIGRTVSERVQSEIADERKVFLPSRVMTALLHLVDARGRTRAWDNCSLCPWQRETEPGANDSRVRDGRRKAGRRRSVIGGRSASWYLP